MSDKDFMLRALELANEAAKLGEAPVGAVIVRNGEIVSEGFNRRETGKNALAHAEIIAINEACKRLGGWRLWECEMFVTLEPCIMCGGAIINSRIRRVVIAAHDKRFGTFGGLVDLNSLGFNHKPQVEYGLFENEASELMSDFFKKLRKK